MTQKIILEIEFICADHIALLRSLEGQKLLPAGSPKKVAVHGRRVDPQPSDWIPVEFGTKMLKVDWADGSFVIVIGRDLVHVSTRGFLFDVEDVVRKLTTVEFEAASFKEFQWWDNPQGPGYTAPDGTIGTSPLGFAVAYKGKGHERPMSRRWLDRGPWRVLRDLNDTTFLQFQDVAANVSTSVEQVKPCHALMSDRVQAPLPLRRAYAPGKVPLQGTYVAPEKKLIVSVAGRSISRREMREAVAARTYQLLGADKPLDNVVYSFIDKAELDAALPDLWLYGLEARLRDASGAHRVDEAYVPPAYEKPAWVQALGRDDKVVP